MADDNLEQNTGGTFAEDLGVEIEYAEVEDVSAEQFNKYIETAAAELNPPLLHKQELTYEDEPQDTMEFGEYLSFLGTLLNEQSGMMTLLGDRLERISSKIDSIQEVMMSLTESGVTAVLEVCTDDGEDLEDLFGDEDLDDYEPKRKGTPGRPAKEAPKTTMPPKREKPKKTAVKKKAVAKVVAKKKVPAKKKAAKKKSKR